MKIKKIKNKNYELFLYSPDDRIINKTLLLSSAMGIKHTYYKYFIRECIKNKIQVICYDLIFNKEENLSYLRLVEILEEILQYIDSNKKEIILFGHSLGGQISIIHRQLYKHKRKVFICTTGSTHIQSWEKYYKIKILFLILSMKYLSRIIGYFPGRFFKFHQNISNQIIFDWCSPCLKGKYFIENINLEYFEEISENIWTYNIKNDLYCPLSSTQHFLSQMNIIQYNKHVFNEASLFKLHSSCHFNWARKDSIIIKIIGDILNEKVTMEKN